MKIKLFIKLLILITLSFSCKNKFQNKSEQEILDLIEDLIQDHKDQCSLKKIESLEKKLINNLDENSYSELIKLKSQLNRD